MVRHGRDRKRRSGLKGRTKIGVRKWHRYNVRINLVQNPTILAQSNLYSSSNETNAHDCLYDVMFISPLLSFLVLYFPLSQPNPTFGDARVKKHWDPSKSPSVNLSNLGLSALPNDMNNARTSSTPVTKTTATVVELFDIPESDKPSLRQRYPLEQEEEEYIAKCMEKHGDDYTAMRRDIRTNNMQHTEEQLRKWGSRYLLLTPSQRRLPVPETVQPLLPAKQQTQPTAMASQTSTASDDDDDE